MKIGISAILLFLLGFSVPQVSALSVTPTQPIPENSGLIITAYGTSANQASLDVLQIYNSNDTIFSLDGWSVGAITTTQASPRTLFLLAGYMKAESHGVYAKNGSIVGVGVYPFSPPVFSAGERLTKLVLLPPSLGVMRPEQPVAYSDVVSLRSTTSTGYST